MSKTLTQKILDKKYAELKDDLETVIARKISNKIENAKNDFLKSAKDGKISDNESDKDTEE